MFELNLEWQLFDNDVDDRIYQRENGTMYIKSNEFVRSEEGRKLIKRFSENIEEGDVIRD